MRSSILLVAVTVTILTIAGSGCTSVARVNVPVERPVLPSISQDELSCLSDETYRKLELRDRLRRQYAEQLEVLNQ